MTLRQFAVLHLLVTRAGTLVPKETLLKTVWGDVAVGDNSVERMMSDIRVLLDPVDRRQYTAVHLADEPRVAGPRHP